LSRTRAGNAWRFSARLRAELCEELGALCADEPPLSSEFGGPPRHLEAYVRLLEASAPVREVSNGLAYRFTRYEPPSRTPLAVTKDNAGVLEGGFENLVEELPAWQPFVALVEGGRAVSVCRSARITAEAHEAGVETLPDFRGRGYAKEVVAEWARLVLAAGALPLYSTELENRASQAVARKLHLELYAADFQIA
jgi:GNAT superfamily N-acetyltransferase